MVRVLSVTSVFLTLGLTTYLFGTSYLQWLLVSVGKAIPPLVGGAFRLGNNIIRELVEEDPHSNPMYTFLQVLDVQKESLEKQTAKLMEPSTYSNPYAQKHLKNLRRLAQGYEHLRVDAREVLYRDGQVLHKLSNEWGEKMELLVMDFSGVTVSARTRASTLAFLSGLRSRTQQLNNAVQNLRERQITFLHDVTAEQTELFEDAEHCAGEAAGHAGKKTVGKVVIVSTTLLAIGGTVASIALPPSSVLLAGVVASSVTAATSAGYTVAQHQYYNDAKDVSEQMLSIAVVFDELIAELEHKVHMYQELVGLLESVLKNDVNAMEEFLQRLPSHLALGGMEQDPRDEHAADANMDYDGAAEFELVQRATQLQAQLQTIADEYDHMQQQVTPTAAVITETTTTTTTTTTGAASSS